MMGLLGYSLRLEERLSPSEKVIQRLFFGEENIDKVVSMVHVSVDKFLSRGDVVDVMHDLFTRKLGENSRGLRNSHGVIDEINATVVATMLRQKKASNKASQISRRIGFETNKIPVQLLPRASFSLESEDEDRGKVSYMFM